MTLLLSLQDIVVSRGERRVLDGASLELRAGERLALVGPNGAGKTTLLRTLIGLEAAAAGEIVAFGRPCRSEKDFRAMRARAGYLFQDADDQLFCPTVIDDVAFGPLNLGLSPDIARARAAAVLDQLELGALASRVTHRLSGGEKRLVALAGVLAMEPDVLLLDEPTNALDETHYRRLVEILSGLPQAMIIVSHDRWFLHRLSSRVAALKDGRLLPAVFHGHPHTHDHLHLHIEGAGDHHRH
ncbi:energy-coupling factor ABC transporter ATP-binding protein [Zavarzinia compransoris]|uniref:Cobalt ABC transporter ATP-binding protein n=1 Tax=Zavarzinia compransoris TaxID=1264899 RepID=A0A317E7M8_9PROT|nr:ABC transporter ATP-binding protein [Zavarzinia compransoris]PWR23138.1 cobalt ABC transporter ATP-binding protein [Zavarzinia compransoris]TDP46307.1 cobalt/nickel transport system ATP-binding protein [Zavarzinia compransoris]